MTPKIGRNDPCWCGSGKKYKKYHIDRDSQDAVRPWEVDLAATGVVMAEIHEGRGTNKPSAFGDYDTNLGIGRVII